MQTTILKGGYDYTETDKKNILSFVNKNNINNYLIDTMLNVLNYLITIYK